MDLLSSREYFRKQVQLSNELSARLEKGRVARGEYEYNERWYENHGEPEDLNDAWFAKERDLLKTACKCGGYTFTYWLENAFIGDGLDPRMEKWIRKGFIEETELKAEIDKYKSLHWLAFIEENNREDEEREEMYFPDVDLNRMWERESLNESNDSSYEGTQDSENREWRIRDREFE